MTFAPIPNQSVDLVLTREGAEPERHTVSTDADGTASLTLAPPVAGAYSIAASSALFGVPANVAAQNVEVSDPSQRVLLTTDKPIYKPGQTVHLRALSLAASDRRPNGGASVTFEIEDGKGNKILKNKIHDVTDASIMDSNGYGGHGVCLDNATGSVDVENNLVDRVSGFAVYTPHGPAFQNQPNTVKNNIMAYARLAIAAVGDQYKNPPFTVIPQSFVFTNNLVYFDRTANSSPKFLTDGGCLYTSGAPFTQYQSWRSNLYWRTDGAFASDPKAFGVQATAGTGPQAPCGNFNIYTFYTFATWQKTEGEDLQSVVQNPGFKSPAYPADDYSLPQGSPGVGFIVFDPNEAGRTNPVIKPPSVPATFPTKSFNPATDY